MGSEVLTDSAARTMFHMITMHCHTVTTTTFARSPHKQNPLLWKMLVCFCDYQLIRSIKEMTERSNGDKIGACEKSSMQTLAEPRVGSLWLLAGSPFGTKETPDEQNGIWCCASSYSSGCKLWDCEQSKTPCKVPFPQSSAARVQGVRGQRESHSLGFVSSSVNLAQQLLSGVPHD